jgi:gas vesicle protein
MSDQSGNVILGTLIGAALGFAAGVLFAPAKGEETREALKEKATDAKKTVDELATSTLDSLKKIKENVEANFRDTQNTVQREAKHVKADAKEELGKVQA